MPYAGERRNRVLLIVGVSSNLVDRRAVLIVVYPQGVVVDFANIIALEDSLFVVGSDNGVQLIFSVSFVRTLLSDAGRLGKDNATGFEVVEVNVTHRGFLCLIVGWLLRAPSPLCVMVYRGEGCME